MSTTKVPTNIKIANWGEVKQQLFFEGKQIVNATKSVQAGAGATTLEYTTKDGRVKKFYFADQVVILDREAMNLRKQAMNDIWARFTRQEISADQFTQAIKELEA